MRDSCTLQGSGSSGGVLSDGCLSGIRGGEGLEWKVAHSGASGDLASVSLAISTPVGIKPGAGSAPEAVAS